MSNNVRISTETVTKTFAEVIINGESKGKREVNGGPSLKEFATSLAKEYGIRTFTVTVDDAPVTAASASQPVPAGASISVQAKDSRGAAEADASEGQAESQADGAAEGEESSEGSEEGAGEESSEEEAEEEEQAS